MTVLARLCSWLSCSEVAIAITMARLGRPISCAGDDDVLGVVHLRLVEAGHRHRLRGGRRDRGLLGLAGLLGRRGLRPRPGPRPAAGPPAAAASPRPRPAASGRS